MLTSTSTLVLVLFFLSSCSACSESRFTHCRQHPLLLTPVCGACWKAYHTGEFTVEDGTQSYHLSLILHSQHLLYKYTPFYTGVSCGV